MVVGVGFVQLSGSARLTGGLGFRVPFKGTIGFFNRVPFKGTTRVPWFLNLPFHVIVVGEVVNKSRSRSD